MNAKIEKTAREIEKTRARIAEDQARLRDLERQKVDLENTEIVNLFRSVDVAPSEFAAFIKAFKAHSGGEAAPDFAPAQAPVSIPQYPQAGYRTASEDEEDNSDE